MENVDDPGRFFVYERDSEIWTEFLQTSPAIKVDEINPAQSISFTAPAGHTITGRVTFPHNPLINPPPLICLYRNDLWRPGESGYSATNQMLAEFGCIVLEIDYRGSAGAGPRNLMGARHAPDQAAFDDMRAAINWVGERQPYDTKRVAAIGVGYGAWLALRSAELDPELFRCVVSMNGFNSLSSLFQRAPKRERADQRIEPFRQLENVLNFQAAALNDMQSLANMSSSVQVELAPTAGATPDAAEGPGVQPSFQPIDSGNNQLSFFNPTDNIGTEANVAPSRLRYTQRLMDDIEYDPVDLPAAFAEWYFAPIRSDINDLSVIRHADKLTAQVLICEDVHDPSRDADDARALRRRLNSLRRGPEYWEVPVTNWSRPIQQRPEVWLRVAEFFNENLYVFDVDIGTVEEVK